MSSEQVNASDPRILMALTELQELIRGRYPNATFQVAPGEDPEGVYLDATVDVVDTDEVMDVVVDRLLAMQVEEGLPVYVIALRPVERVLEAMRSAKLPRRYRALEGGVPQAIVSGSDRSGDGCQTRGRLIEWAPPIGRSAPAPAASAAHA